MYSLHELDEKMLDYINYENGFFIECGANDGVCQSNTLLLEEKLNWKGLLVEPSNINYIKCKQNRPNCIVENYALVSMEYGKNHISGNFGSIAFNGLMNSAETFPEYFDDTMKYWASKFKLEHKSETSLVPCCTLQSLIDKHKIENIDFFSLDVEGYEIEVLKGLDFTKIRPTYILIETTTHEYYREIITSYMLSKNYKKIEEISINDVLYRNN